jgi:signal transduction histidine kinase
MDPSHTRLRVLAAVSHAFATVVTDHAQLLQSIARTTAELVGDGCLVTLLGEDHETLHNAASAHRRPELDADYRSYLAGRGISKSTSGAVAATVIRSGVARLVPEVDPATLVAQSDEHIKPLAARLDVRSFVVVPIRARQVIIGSLSLFRSGPGQPYGPDDLVLLEDIADRAGLAIENARLYDELERRVRQRTAELEAANRELEAFSRSVAHDLRAPLRSIDGFGRALAEDHAAQLDAEGQHYLTRIRAAAQHMGRLIDDLLGLSRVTRGELRRRRVDLSEIARRVLAHLHEAEPGRRVSITVADGLHAEGDLALCEVLLTNLLGNAWKFTGKKPDARIELGVHAGSTPPVFFVRDNGAGFDPAHAGKLFGTFERLHTTSEFDGIGIGLATVQRIVQRHGGRVWAEGEVERGASFYFTLEAEAGAASSPITPARP